MRFHEFGDKKNPHIMLIHGGGNAWWNFLRQGRVLGKKYHVIIPTLDGHGEEYETPYVSTEVTVDKLMKYIEKECDGKLFALCGVSLGGQIVIELLSRKSDLAKKAIIDGTVCYPTPFMKTFCICSTKIMGPLLYGKKSSERLLKQMDKMLPQKMHYPQEIKNYYMEDMPRTPKETLTTMYRTYMDYNLKESLRDTRAEVMYWYGEKEMRCVKKSAELFKSYVPSCKLYEAKGYNHGYLAVYIPEEWLELACDFFEKII